VHCCYLALPVPMCLPSELGFTADGNTDTAVPTALTACFSKEPWLMVAAGC